MKRKVNTIDLYPSDFTRMLIDNRVMDAVLKPAAGQLIPLTPINLSFPWEKAPDHPQKELVLSHMWPELGLNSQQWDYEWFRALKISILNYLANLLMPRVSYKGPR